MAQAERRRASTIAPGPWIEHLERFLPIARAGLDIEGVHQVRVASGRLGTFLRMADQRLLRDDLRWLRRRASAVRDLDVLLQRRLPEPFSDWLSGERLVARAALIEALDSSRAVALLRALNRVPALERARGRAARARFAAHVSGRASAAARDGATFEEFHALRRSVRRLRYAEEWLGRERPHQKRLQDALGELNDAVVAQRLYNEWPEREQVPALGVALDRTADAAREHAVLELARFSKRHR